MYLVKSQIKASLETGDFDTWGKFVSPVQERRENVSAL